MTAMTMLRQVGWEDQKRLGVAPKVQPHLCGNQRETDAEMARKKEEEEEEEEEEEAKRWNEFVVEMMELEEV